MAPSFVKSAPAREFWIDDQVPEVCLLGRSNVGKSSLVNALAKKTMALSSKNPGRTQMANFYDFDKFRIVDLPGYGYSRASKGKKEAFSLLIEEYLDQRANLRCPVLVVDGRNLTQSDVECAQALQQKFAKMLVAVNKIDILTMSQGTRLQERVATALDVSEDVVFLVSAKEKTKTDALLKAIYRFCM